MNMSTDSSPSWIPACSELWGGSRGTANVTNNTESDLNGWDWLTNIEWFISGGATSAVCFTGVTLNIISMLVFLRRRPVPVLYYYLTGVGLWDMVLLASSALMYSLPTLYFGNMPTTGSLYIYTYIYWYTLGNMALIGNVWIVWVMTCDRYIAICHPLRHQYITALSGKKGSAIISITVTSIAALMYGIPRYFELALFYCYDNMEQQVVAFLSPTSLYLNRMYNFVYKAIGGLLFCSVLPYIVIITFVVKIFIKIRKANNWRKRKSSFGLNVKFTPNNVSVSARHSPHSISRKEMSEDYLDEHERRRSQSANNIYTPSLHGLGAANTISRRHLSGQQDNTNLVFVIVVIKFLVSHIMPTALDIAEETMGSKNFRYSRHASSAVTISNFLVVLNSASNFLVYFFWMPKFRIDFKDLCTGKWRRNRKMTNETNINGIEDCHASGKRYTTGSIVIRSRIETEVISTPPPILHLNADITPSPSSYKWWSKNSYFTENGSPRIRLKSVKEEWL